MKANNNPASENGNPLNEILIECLMRREKYLNRMQAEMRAIAIRRDGDGGSSFPKVSCMIFAYLAM
jgi:hypothetical protein